MSFKKYLMTEAVLFLLIVSMLPIWLPVWLFVMVKDWYADCRSTWECMERDRIRSEARAAAMTQQVPERAE